MGAHDLRRASGWVGKKKELIELEIDQKPVLANPERFKSILSRPEAFSQKPTLFLPPEAFGHSASSSDDDPFIDFQSASNWDIATRYHEFKARKANAHLVRELRSLSAKAILDRAQAVMGSVVHPVEQMSAPWFEVPAEAEHIEMDLDETIENAPLIGAPDLPGFEGALDLSRDIWMTYQVPRRQSVVLSVDTSLSMTGEKLALTAVALAVVLLQFPDDPVGIIAFENAAQILKRPDEKISLQQLIERFLDVPAQGYTHLEDGMKVALQMVQSTVMMAQSKPASTVLLTDGKYTAGRDPAYLAPRFPHLTVLKMGHERASLELCRELARKGKGALREVGDLETLPMAMYGVVKDLLRGKSII